MTTLQKVIKYLAIAFAIFLTVSIVGGILSAVGLLGSLFSDDDAEWGDVIGETKTYTVSSEISDLNIQINAADFYIKEGNGFSVESNLKNLEVDEKNGCLTLKDLTKIKLNGSNAYENAVLTIYVPVGTVFDNLAYQTVIWKGFGHEGDLAELEKMLANKVLPPNRRSELCLAVVDETGEFAAHCTCWYDERTDYAYVEPVCTIPKYRGMGLGKAVVLEALRRCKVLGVKQAFVISDQDFYKKLGFVPHSQYIFFKKI